MNKPQRRTKPSRTKGNSTSSSSSLNTATSSPASSNTWSERLSRYQSASTVSTRSVGLRRFIAIFISVSRRLWRL